MTVYWEKKSQNKELESHALVELGISSFNETLPQKTVEINHLKLSPLLTKL